MFEKIPAAPSRVPTGPRPSQATIDGVRLVLEGGWTISSAAEQVGVSPSAISRRIKSIKNGAAIHEAEDSRAYRERSAR